jgi:hypothetical protein
MARQGACRTLRLWCKAPPARRRGCPPHAPQQSMLHGTPSTSSRGHYYLSFLVSGGGAFAASPDTAAATGCAAAPASFFCSGGRGMRTHGVRVLDWGIDLARAGAPA